MNEAKPMLFAAYCEHGKIRAATVDDMDSTMHCAADVAGYKKWATKIERVEGPLEISLWKCEPCDEKKKRRKSK